MKSAKIILSVLSAAFVLGVFSSHAQNLPQKPHNHFAGGYMWQKLAPQTFTKADDGEYRILVILAQFSDVSFFYDSTYFHRMLTADAYRDFGAEGSVRQYLEDQLGAKVQIDIAGPVTVGNTRDYYGRNNSMSSDSHPGEFVAEACQAVSSWVDFARYDADSDGYVDNVMVIFAGEDEAQVYSEHPEYIWSHSYNLLNGDYGRTLEFNGVQVNNYAVTAELYRLYDSSGSYNSQIAPIGTFCHEYMHNFGIPDFYDTDGEGSGGTAAAMWRVTALMDSGNYNHNGNTPPYLNAVERECLGIVVPKEIQSGDYALYPIGSDKAYVLRLTNPSDENEYYLFEARKASSWDSYIGLDENETGMLVYHVDKSRNNRYSSDTYGSISSWDRWHMYNEVNANPGYQCADLIEADGRSDINPSENQRGDLKGLFFPALGASAIGGDSKIPFTFRSGGKSDFGLQNIRVEDSCVKFTVINLKSPLPPLPQAAPADEDFLYIVVIYQKGGAIQLRVNNSFGAQVKWFYDGNPIEPDGSFVPSVSGTIRAEVDWPDGNVDYLFKSHKVSK